MRLYLAMSFWRTAGEDAVADVDGEGAKDVVVDFRKEYAWVR